MDYNYYVYVYYRLDINEPFYIGMGHNDRWKDIWKRNNHFKRIMNKYPIVCEIIKDNLTEDEAHDIECWLINKLVFEYGYSINIPNNRSDEKGMHLVNCTWGGEGTSGCNPFENKTEEEIKEWKEKIGKANSGKSSFANKTEDEMSIIRKKISKAVSGENNGMYGKIGKLNPMYDIHRYGESNPFYGKHHTEESKRKISESQKGKTDSEETKLKKKKSHKNPIICITTKRIFQSAKEGAKYYNCFSNHINYCCRGYRIQKGKKYKVTHAGKLLGGTPLVWRKLIWNHNKKYRVKEED